DILYKERAQKAGIVHFARARTVGCHPAFIAALADLGAATAHARGCARRAASKRPRTPAAGPEGPRRARDDRRRGHLGPDDGAPRGGARTRRHAARRGGRPGRFDRQRAPGRLSVPARSRGGGWTTTRDAP